MSDLKKLLGKRIKEIRLSRNLTQEQLSDLTDIGASSISKIESGIYHPTDENLERISKALDVEPYKLYMFNHKKNKLELLDDINIMLKKATESELELAYRVLNGILD